jgi:hypothetical protein
MYIRYTMNQSTQSLHGTPIVHLLHMYPLSFEQYLNDSSRGPGGKVLRGTQPMARATVVTTFWAVTLMLALLSLLQF